MKGCAVMEISNKRIAEISQQYRYLMWNLFRVTPQGKKRARLIKPEEIEVTQVRPQTYKSDAVTEYTKTVENELPKAVADDLLKFKNEVEDDISSGAITSIAQLSGKLNSYTDRMKSLIENGKSNTQENAKIDLLSYVLPFNSSADFGRFAKEVVPNIKADGISGNDFKKIIALQVKQIASVFPNPSAAVIEHALGIKLK